MCSLMRYVFTIVLLQTALVRAIDAQTLVQVPVGSRVRVTSTDQPGAGQWTGNLVAATNDSITVRVPGRRAPIGIALNTSARVELSQGFFPSFGQGIGTGAGIGAFAGLVIGIVTYEPCEYLCIMDYGPAGNAVGGAFAGGFAGALAGGLFVAFVGSEKWRTVLGQPQSPRLVLRSSGGDALSVALKVPW